MTKRWWIGLNQTLMRTTEVEVDAETQAQAELLALQRVASKALPEEWSEALVQETQVNYAEEADD